MQIAAPTSARTSQIRVALPGSIISNARQALHSCGSIDSSNASIAGSISGCSGCPSTPSGSFHGFLAGPMAERAGIVYGFDTSVGGIDKITGAAAFTRVTPINGN